MSRYLLLFSIIVSLAAGPTAVAEEMAAAERLIAQQAVNDPGADTPLRNVQNTTTMVDLGGGKLVVAFFDAGSFPGGTSNHQTGYAYSSDNGLSWTDAGRLPDSAEGDGGNPVLATHAATDDVYLATLGLSTLTNIQVFKSTDDGHTFGAPVNGSPGYSGGGNVQDRPWMAVDNFAGAGNGNVYLCWNRFAGNSEIRLTRSLDGGATFLPNLGRRVAGGGPGCFVVVSPNHQVYIFYIRGTGPGGQGGNNRLFMRRSLDRGVTFEPEVPVADLKTTTTWGSLPLNDGLLSNSFPQAAVNPVAARPFLYVIYNDDPSPADPAENANIYVVHSTDNGVTWSAPVRVNDDIVNDQFLPNIAFRNGGERLLITYFSRNHDPQNFMFHRRGRIGVLNPGGPPVFNASFQLGPNTEAAVNPKWPGDYQAIAGGAVAVSTAWADTRFPPAAGGAPQPDVFFARLTLPPANADVGVALSASPASVKLGRNTVLKATVTATGGSATDVFFHLDPAHGLAYTSATADAGSCTLINQSVDCSLRTIPSGGSKNVYVLATAVYSAATRTVSAAATTSSRDTVLTSPLDPNAHTVNVPVTPSDKPPVVETFSSQNIAEPIPDGNGDFALAALETPVLGVVIQMVVKVRIDHENDEDLIIDLAAPQIFGGRPPIKLAVREGKTGDNYGQGPNSCIGTRTHFSDLAPESIRGKPAPFTGDFRGQTLLRGLFNEVDFGIMGLRVTDGTANGIAGTLGCVDLTITYIPE